MCIVTYRMSDNPEQSSTATQVAGRSSGRVKWFNNKHGYGFITCSSSDRPDEDIFVHHTALRTGEDQYRYLVQGEYVEFDWSKTDAGAHEWQATGVTGMGAGKLMCETRNDTRQQARSSERRPRWTEGGDGDEAHSDRPPHRIRGGGPREDDENVEWRLVKVRRGNTKGRRQGQVQGDTKGGRRAARPRDGDDV